MSGSELCWNCFSSCRPECFYLLLLSVAWILTLVLEDLTGFYVRCLVSPSYILSEFHSKFQILVHKAFGWVLHLHFVCVCVCVKYLFHV